jgi:hypothetical protein
MAMEMSAGRHMTNKDVIRIQVCTGAAVGAAFAATWSSVIFWLARHWLPHLQSWKVSKVLYFKDTFPLGPDILAWEKSRVLFAEKVE